MSASAPSRSRLDVTIGIAVVVGIEPEPVRRDRAVEADEHREGGRDQAREQRHRDHLEAARALAARRRATAMSADTPSKKNTGIA